MGRRGKRRGLGRVAPALAALTCAFAASPGTAAATSACDGSNFCITSETTLASSPPGLIAAAPLTLDLSAANTSSPLNRAHWLHSTSFSLGEPGGPQPVLTPSSQLPDGLLIAGGGPCNPPSFAECGAGHGTLLAHIDSFGTESDTTGAFGISKIVNVNPPAPGTLLDYEVTIKSCVYTSESCSEQAQRTVDLHVGAGETEFDLTTEFKESAPPFFSAEASLESLSLHLAGQSSQLESGPAGATYTVATLPRDCGEMSADATFVSREAGEVEIPESFTITGCPTAALGPYGRQGKTIHLDGSGSTSPVAGRSIARWHWNFGDGSSEVTTTPRAEHDFPPGSEHTVSLFVEDSAGARSPGVTQQVSVPPGHVLTVALAGSGAGTVSGGGISCPEDCSELYGSPTTVTLMAAPAAGSQFAGWSGDCSGTGACQVAVDAERSVTATFERAGAGTPQATPAAQGAQGKSSTPAPPSTTLLRAKVKGSRAVFKFSASGAATGFQCALTKLGKHSRRAARFSGCGSPKAYPHLRRGGYVFQVRATGPGGADPTPARKRFAIHE